ncbi:cell division protein ZapE [Parvularcula dongshanensis]|uniref:Cell division protein ZapE n=1 Tax=Parvularcula dongshanensis TaxID=1173995 RepID=A0A840HZU6_9PROT|nr:cell division protein ZapE [Parvularcula dongshanensis]MBB4658099.1 cell division protein ZapE [Parvularcula dongshanensis]
MSGPLARYRALLDQGKLQPDPAQAEAAEALQTVHDALSSYEPPRFSFLAGEPPLGLYLWGGVGAGKSLLMDLFFETAPVPDDEKRRVHFHAFMGEAQRFIARWRAMEDKDRRAHPARARRASLDDPIPHAAKALFLKARLLCFDEFQVTDVADAMILSRLFGELWNRGAVIVATSNRVPEDLYLDGLNRPLFLPFIDELKAHARVLHVEAARDYRLGRLERSPVYHCPLGPEADAAMDEAWHDLTAGAAQGRQTLRVDGRDVPVTAARGAMRESFDALCGAALGPSDYLEMARTFPAVLLEGVPVMGPESRNEAKRFVTLIDSLYEHRCKLIVSAAAAPDDLYPAGDGSFEFARTASRLHEMQSRDYLAEAHREAG